MKKTIYLFITVLTFIFLTGCGGDNSSNSNGVDNKDIDNGNESKKVQITFSDIRNTLPLFEDINASGATNDKVQHSKIFFVKEDFDLDAFKSAFDSKQGWVLGSVSNEYTRYDKTGGIYPGVAWYSATYNNAAKELTTVVNIEGSNLLLGDPDTLLEEEFGSLIADLDIKEAKIRWGAHAHLITDPQFFAWWDTLEPEKGYTCNSSNWTCTKPSDDGKFLYSIQNILEFKISVVQ